MKKYLYLVALVLIATSTQADFWDNCTAYGGTIITANSYGNDKSGLCNDPSDPNVSVNCNGKRFCVGPVTNWWSAFTWCESIGGKQASFASLCPGSQILASNNANACPNLQKTFSSGVGWTDMGWGPKRALFVTFSNGAVRETHDGGGRESRTINHPLCEAK